MKSISMLFLSLLYASGMVASVRNVSNAPDAPVNPPYTYDNLQDAIDAALDGDTIYLHGTNISYGNVTITNKTLVIIGAGFGHNLQSNFNQRTIVGNITFASYDGTKNISLIGLLLNEPKCGTTTTNIVNTLYMERCGMMPVPSSTNKLRCNTFFFRQSVTADQQYYEEFAPVVLSTAYISNSVIAGNISGSTIGTAVFENNIFKKVSTNSNAGSITSFSGTASFTNNIFMNDYGIAVSNCVFNHNLFANATSLGSGNNGVNNQLATSPAFVNNTGVTTNIGRSNYATQVDYRLTAGSTAIGTGTGGSDLGVYGGTNPVPANQLLNGVPALPRITQMTIQQMSAAPGGTLEVQVEAVKQD